MEKGFMFAGLPVHVVTCHGKERVLQPLLEEKLGLHGTLYSGQHTDSLGTFTGEVERSQDPLETLRKKCRLAFNDPAARLSLASEGSFGPHPSYYFIPADEEWLMLTDREGQFELVVRHISTTTNFGAFTITRQEEWPEAAHKLRFPSHGLIVRNAPGGVAFLKKGIQEPAILDALVKECLTQYGQAVLESDMRAFQNPTRMNVIAEAGQKLVELALSACPACNWPGWSWRNATRGLPCSWCGNPTPSPLHAIKGCLHCGYFSHIPFPDGKSSEDPMYCTHCNP